MSQPTKKQFQQDNIDTVSRLLQTSGLALVPGAPFEVEDFEAPGFELAVRFQLKTVGGPLHVRAENNDPAREAFARTSSFSFSLVTDVSHEQAVSLREFVGALAPHDAGNLKLVRPAHIGALPMVANPDFQREPFWSRDLFEQRFGQLGQLPEQNGGVTIVVLQACTMNCVFCPEGDRVGLQLIGEDKDADDHLQDLLVQLERGRRAGAEAVEFGGSDVLRFKHAIELFNAAGKLGYKRIIAQSPGQLLGDPEFAAAVAASPLTEVWVPIYGTTAEIHDAVVGTPGAFEGLVKAVETSAKFGRPAIRLHTIALKRTLPHLEELIDFCFDRFDRPVLVSCLRPNRDGEVEHFADMIRFSDTAEVIRRRPMHFFEFPLCVFPEDAALEIYRVRQQLTGGLKRPVNFFDFGLSANSEHDLVRQARTVQFPKECKECLLKSACPAIIGAYLEHFDDSEVKPFTDEAKLQAAMARTGEAFPGTKMEPRHRLELLTGVCNLTE